MAHFVSLVNWTDQGVRAYEDTLDRAKAFSHLAAEAGGRVVGMWWTMGAYDLVAVIDAPDDESATALMLKVSAGGNVRTLTMRAFDGNEMAGILAKA
ncbi:MAG: GYD domain-containing protein, partial [Acidimicrobiales bacterium]